MPNPARPSMADLISKVRRLIQDNGTIQQFNDLEIQDELDRNRDDINYEELAVKATLDPSGRVTWLEFYAPVGDWESDTLIYGYIAPNAFADITAGGLISTTSPPDYLVGKWTLTTSTRPPMYIVGKTYDVHMAASGLASQWAASLARKFDASQQGVHASRSQMYTNMMKLSDELAARRRPRLTEMARRDVMPRWGQGQPQGQPVR
jgi:hypothetical protein